MVALVVVHALVLPLCWVQGQHMSVEGRYGAKVVRCRTHCCPYPIDRIIFPTSPTDLAHINTNIPTILGGTFGRLVPAMPCDPRLCPPHPAPLSKLRRRICEQFVAAASPP